MLKKVSEWERESVATVGNTRIIKTVLNILFFWIGQQLDVKCWQCSCFFLFHKNMIVGVCKLIDIYMDDKKKLNKNNKII